MYIYKLSFDTGEFYVGKTTGSFTLRLNTHCNRLNRGKHHNKKMQSLFNKNKTFPSIEVLERVTSHSIINERERYWIKKFSSFGSLLNLTEGGEGPGVGELNHQAKYVLDDYTAIVSFLALTDMSLIDISKELDVSMNTVRHISCGESHHYLRDIMPIEYDIMISKKGTRKLPKRIYKYPNMISPSGEVHNITNLLQFGKQHNLDNSTLSKVIRNLPGYKSIKGWKVHNE